jgi:hypothetical protein
LKSLVFIVNKAKLNEIKLSLAFMPPVNTGSIGIGKITVVLKTPKISIRSEKKNHEKLTKPKLNLKTMHKFKTTNIKGKDYVEVNQRLLYFRNESAYAGWSLESEIFDLQPDRCCVRAVIRDNEGRIRATGHASEDRTSSMINKTSYVENCETSAWGRALACIGIGIETSIASSNEVQMAIAQQNLGDLNDKLGLVPSYDELTTATLKADFLALLDKLPKEQQAKFMKDIDHMTPARFEKGIQFIQNQLAKS